MKYIVLLTIAGTFNASFAGIPPLKMDNMSNIFLSKSDKIVELRLDNPVLRSAFSPDGRIFAASDDQKTLRLWDTKSWTVLHNLTHTDAAYSPIFSPDSTILVTSTHALAKGGLRHEIFWFWDVKTGKSLSVYDRGDVEEGSSPMAFSPDGKKLACGTDRGTVKLVDIHDLKNIKIIYEKTDLMSYYSIRSMSFSPNGTYLAVAALENPFIIIDVSTGKEVFRNKGIQHAYQIAFSPDGKTLTIAGKLWKKDNHKLTVRLFNIDSWKMTGDFRDHDATDGLGFTSDGSSLVFIGEPNVEVYNIRTKRVIKSITFKYLLSATSIAPDGKSIAIGYLLGNTIQIHSIGAKGK